jgi:hypothetical protein
MTPIALRAATPGDSEFCYQLHKAAMGGYITAIWGWDEQQQRAFHARAFNPGNWQIITAGQADIGMLDVEYRPGEICIGRIEIHPIIKARASVPASSVHSPMRPGGRGRTWSSRCSPSTTGPRLSTNGLV